MPSSAPDKIENNYSELLAQIIHDISDDKERFGNRLIENEREVGAFFIDVYSGMNGQARHMEINGADVWLAFVPDTEVVIPVQGAKEGEKHYETSTYGQVVVHHLNKQGQHYHDTLPSDVSLSDFLRMDEGMLMQRVSHKHKFRHLLQNPDFKVNSIHTSTEIPQGYEPGTAVYDEAYEEINKVYFGSPIFGDETFVSPVDANDMNVRDVTKSAGDMYAAVKAFVTGDNPGNIKARFHIRSLHGSKDRSRVFGMLADQHYASTPEYFKTVIRNAVEAGNNEVKAEVGRRIKSRIEGLVPHVTPEMARLMTAEPVKNFVSAGETESSRKFRYQFVEQLQNMMFGNVDMERFSKDVVVTTLNELISIKDGHITDPEVIADIDSGKFPAHRIVSNFGFPNMSKKQFARALSIMGEQYHGMNGSGRSRPNHPFRKMLGYKNELHDAFALACLPKEWFQWSPDGKDILNARDLYDIAAEKEQVFRAEEERMRNSGESTMPHAGHIAAYDIVGDIFEKMKPSLVKTAEHLDLIKGEIQDASSPDETRLAKRKMKQVASKWSWLAKSDTPMTEKMARFDEQFRVSASYDDYERLMGEFIETINRRVVTSNSNLPERVLTFNRDYYEINLLTGIIDSKYKEYIDGKAERQEPEEIWDPDLEVYITKDTTTPPSLSMGPLVVPNQRDAAREIRTQCDNFKELANLNNELHKYHGRIVREANRNTAHDLSWSKLTDAPLRLGNYVIDTVNSRLDLLLEGTEMDHCAFSYMGACMAGESVIMSARDASTGDRVATIELVPEYEEDENGNVTATYEVQQCFGIHNMKTDEVSKVEALINDWVDAVNNGDIPTNAAKLKEGSDEQNEELLDDVSLFPETEGDLVCSIPFSGDGAYLAYYAFNQYSPEGYSFDALADKNDMFSDIYYESGFRNEIKQIDDLCRDFHIEPMSFVLHKLRYNVGEIKDVPAHMRQHQVIINELESVMQEYGDTLSGEQLLKMCGDVISGHGLVLSGDIEKSILLRPDALDALMEHARALPVAEKPHITPEQDNGPDIAPDAARLSR